MKSTDNGVTPIHSKKSPQDPEQVLAKANKRLYKACITLEGNALKVGDGEDIDLLPFRDELFKAGIAFASALKHYHATKVEPAEVVTVNPAQEPTNEGD